MATYFVKTDGDNGAAGTSWDVAWATAAYAFATAANADTIVLSHTLDEAIAVGTFTGSTSRTATKKIISAVVQAGVGNVDIVYTPGARLDRAGGIYLTGQFAAYGLTIAAEASQLYLTYDADKGVNEFHGCTLISSGYMWIIGNGNTARLYNCTITLGNTGTTSPFAMGSYAHVEMRDCTVTSTAGGAAQGIFMLDVKETVECYGCDFSGITTNTKLADITKTARISFSGCKLPSGWTYGALTNQYTGGSILVERSLNAARTQTAAGLVEFRTHLGAITHDIGTYRTGGANDGDDDYSWKLVGDSTYCSFYSPLVSPPITVWCDQSNPSTPETYVVTVHFGSDTTLTDQNFWIDILYPATTTTHQDGFDTSRGAVGATGVEYDAGGTWTDDTAGAFTPYQWEFSFAPKYPGPITIRANVAGNLTAYICPNIEIA